MHLRGEAAVPGSPVVVRVVPLAQRPRPPPPTRHRWSGVPTQRARVSRYRASLIQPKP